MKTALLLVASALLGVNYSRAQSLGTNLVVETFAGSAFSGTVDGQGTRTMFYSPGPIAVNSQGQIFCSQGDASFRSITPDAVVTTLPVRFGTALSLQIGDSDSLIISSGNVGWGFVTANEVTRFSTSTSSAGVWHPKEKAFFIGYNYRILKVLAGQEKLFAGSGNQAQVDGDGLFSSFSYITAMAVNPAGELLVVDGESLRKVTMQGQVTTVHAKGVGPFSGPSMIVLIDGRILFVSGNRIVVMATDGTTSVLAGSIFAGYKDGPNDSALFNRIGGMELSPTGDLFISDSGNNRIRVIRSALVPQTVPASQTSINLFAGVTITGIPGRSYRIESALNADGPWTQETALQLPDSPHTWIDAKAVAGSRKFYRVLGL